MPQKTHKLYCYVDETGQDTLGKMFIVSVVVTDTRRDELERFLEQLEKDCGKKKRKWVKTRPKEQLAYIEGLLYGEMPGQLYVRIKTDAAVKGSFFEDQQVIASAQAINVYREKHKIDDNYKVTIAIDGLSKNLTPRVGRSFRLLGVKIRNIHGERDQSSPIIRLADAIAGLVRDGVEGRREYKALISKLEKNNKLYRL
ncbi:MAG TPA: DUF3800 domain-containing protein [Candidatus Saccharimonadales bacterium]|nr:DUF3800 domain-containing protein [Candidatus Saccharimonadales bacterium]